MNKILTLKEKMLLTMLIALVGISIPMLQSEKAEANETVKLEVVHNEKPAPVILSESYVERVSELSKLEQTTLAAVEEVIVEESKTYLYDINLSEEDQLEVYNISEQFGLDYELVLAVMMHESKFDSQAIGDHGNSVGIMQIQPRWWTKIFEANGCSDWMSVHDNVTTGCAILQYLYVSYGDTTLMLNAYNTGDPNNFNGYSDDIRNNMSIIAASKI